MKRKISLLLTMLLLSGSAFVVGYLLVRHHQGNRVELAWLKTEFQLSDDQYAKIQEMTAAYEPRCAAMCMAIVSADRELAGQIRENQTMTQGLREALQRADDVRRDCRTSMLAHVYDVAGAMPPEQARRYIDVMTPYLVDPQRAAEGMRSHSRY